MLIIDDSNAHKFANETPDGCGRGYVPRDWAKQPYGSVYGAVGYDGPIIPRTEWDARIDEMTEKKQSLADLNVPVKHQSSTNFCWWNAPVHCMEILNVANGGKYVELSAASGACRQNGFRNEGGWTATSIQRLVDVGVNTVEEWPNATINRKYDTAATRQSALKWRLTEWWELPNTRNRFDIMMTCLFLGFPVAIGLNWWGHEVTAIKPMRIERGRYGVLIDNSWGKDWGDNGRSVLDESRGTPDDAQAPRVPFAH